MLKNLTIPDDEFQTPADNEIANLKELWCECYPGDEEFRDFFFENYYSKDKCVVMKTNDNEIMCVAYYLCGKIRTLNGYEPVVYYYAGGTKPKFRKSGLFKKFNSLLYADMLKRGVSIAVFTANDGLEDMYDKMGYTRCSSIRITRINEIDKFSKSDMSIDRCSFDDFLKLRNEYLLNFKNALIWDEDVMEFMYKDYMDTGDIFLITVDHKRYFSIVTNEQDKIFIHETSIPDQYISEFAQKLRIKYNNDKLIQIYSHHLVTFLNYQTDVQYYGHALLINENLNNSLLNDVYINLIEE